MTKYEIEENRELNKLSLETYFLGLKMDSFSYSVEELVSKLEKEFEDSYQEYLEGRHIKNNQLHNWFFSHDFLTEKLLAISEMKIVYRFKNFEIDLKRLLKATYGINVKELFKWYNVVNFLASKNISITEIEGYKEIDQLREVNNLIKHSDNLENLKILIAEFAGLKKLRHHELLEFYERVEKYCDKFLMSLAQKIHDELYKFDEEKIEKMTMELALRMDKEQAKTFIEKLQEKY